MSTYTQILYHIIFSTKNRSRSLDSENRDVLFKYISGILKNKKCHLYRINGVEDHIHLLTDLPPTISLSSLVKDIKLASTDYIKKNKLFKAFNGWQDGYGAFTYSFKEKDILINYIMNQEKHHQTKTFKDEYRVLLREHHVQFEEKYLP